MFQRTPEHGDTYDNAAGAEPVLVISNQRTRMGLPSIRVTILMDTGRT